MSRETWPSAEPPKEHHDLLRAIKARLRDIDELVDGFALAEEDGVYRYYHQSYKVYSMRDAIDAAQRLFEELAPEGTELNKWLLEMYGDAREHKFDPARTNKNWQAETRPILEAFWHYSYFLRMLARYGRELEEPPEVLPSGWAAVLYLYGIR